MAVSGRVLQDLMPSMIAATAALTRPGRSLINESFAITIALANFVWIVDRSKMILRPARFAAGINPAVTTAPSTAPPARAAYCNSFALHLFRRLDSGARDKLMLKPIHTDHDDL